MDDVQAEDIVIMTVEHLAVIEEVNYLRGVVKDKVKSLENEKVIVKYLERKLADMVAERYA